MKILNIRNFENKSRVLKLEIDGIELNTPNWMPMIKRVRDVELFQSALNITPLDNIGGVVFEAEIAGRYYLNHLKEKKQIKSSLIRNAKTKFEKFRENMRKNNKIILIDPNTNYLCRNAETKKGYLIYLEKYLSPKIKDILSKMIKKGNKSSSREQNENLIEEMKSLIEPIIKFQRDFGVNIFIAPYHEIESKYITNIINKNENYYKTTNNLLNRVYNVKEKLAIPVICLTKNFLNLRSNTYNIPEEWNVVIKKYKEFNAPAYAFKIHYYRPYEFNARKSKQLLKFFRVFKEKIPNKPLIFIGMDEFAYILIYYGLDMFSLPMCKSIYTIKQSSPKPLSTEERDGKYYNHEKLIKISKSEIGKFLTCSCPFCKSWRKVPLNDIKRKDWTYHFMN